MFYTRIKVLLFFILLFFTCNTIHSQNLNKTENNIFGKWKFEKFYWWKYSKFSAVQVDSLKHSVLQIDNDKIFFSNIHFIDTCFFSTSDIKVSKLLDKNNEEYHWYDDSQIRILPSQFTGPLPLHYSKNELSKIIKIDLGCGYDLSVLYLKSDTLIINYLEGITIFLTKINNK